MRTARAPWDDEADDEADAGGGGDGGGDDDADHALLADRAAGADRFDKMASSAEHAKARDELDEKMGFARYVEGPERLGWLINIQPTTVPDSEIQNGKAGVDLYFLEEDGGSFKATLLYQPYLFVVCKPGTEGDVEEFIRRQFQNTILSVTRVVKDDLELANHIAGQKRVLVKISFWNVKQLKNVRMALTQIIDRNRTSGASAGTDDEFFSVIDGQDSIIELREYDVMYYVRVAIDCDIRVGLWYTVHVNNGVLNIRPEPEKLQRAEPVVLAFDIETTKLPLRFPDAQIDSIMMISYMIDGQGFLIINREIVSRDIDDFEYTPKPEYEGHFTIFNEPDEASVIRRFIDHIHLARPTVFATYNGDFFDWPFVEARAAANNINLFSEIGFSKDSSGEFKSRSAIHMDCFAWVKRDSYLPQGSQGLKAVTKYKLGYNPIEIDPEDMTRFAVDQPQTLAQYSVSDAVATYYLYMKYVHPFIFSLCNIIPMNPDDVLRRGSGTLCEHLLMVQSVKSNVIMPNKHADKEGRSFEGHLLESETYVGGHVEALEAGVFRSDIPAQFRLVPEAFSQLIEEVDQALHFSITVEEKQKLEDVVNYDEVRAAIVEKLEALRSTPVCVQEPLIYHLDVAAMYPNIILTNRLQPNAVIDESVCASCDFNQGPGSSCQRRMTWSWRGEFFPASRGEVNMIQNQLRQERFPAKRNDFGRGAADDRDSRPPFKPRSARDDLARAFHELSLSEQSSLLKKRVSDYSRKVYSRVRETRVVERESIVCQREHPFYINTVRDFRDRRYEYKGKHKTWKKNLDAALKENDLAKVDEAKRMIILFDSLQLAHKCILNSFYGYVMRKGARWFSMEMAGIVCLTGARIIQLARSRIEQLGRPLELDTDGIWCILPKSFPETFTFKLKSGKSMQISYPCVMLNHLVHAGFTNHQYQDLSPTGEYVTHSENSIFFEVDGPYRAMILPASTEEDKLLKKRYAVFNHDGSLAELKGFEVKRRGELSLIKDFQSNIFKIFLEGLSLKECYAAVGEAANRWLDILFSKGADLPDSDLFNLISENRSMSKSLKEYGAQKSTSITTARRLAEFLGEQMVRDRGLACRFVISARPQGLPVSERAIPVAIFQADPSVRRHFMRRWLKDASLQDVDIRDVIDWQYYIERFGSVLQKLITIPAAMQSVENPIPRVRHPDWLGRRVAAQEDRFKQRRITDVFSRSETSDVAKDMSAWHQAGGGDADSAAASKRKRARHQEAEEPDFEAGALYSGISGVQVLQIVESDIPGSFVIWVLANGGIQQTRLEVPRRFYMNSRVGDPGELPSHPLLAVTKRMRTLPRSHPCRHLYELEMPETFYIENSTLFAALFNHPDVDGVYETNVSLAFRALIQLGCLCSISRGSGGVASSLVLADIKSDPVAPRSSYLDSQHPLNFCYLFHASNGPRQVLGLVLVPTARCHVVIVDPGNNRDAVPNVQRMYAEALAKLPSHESQAGSGGAFEYPAQLEATTSVFRGEREALAAVNTLLRSYLDQRRGPTALAVQSMRSRKYFENSGLSVLRELPVISVPSHKNDVQFPAIGWQQHGLRRMVGHFLHLSDFLANRIELARYADVPLCNIENDYTLFLSDLFLARRLVKSDALLWFSMSGKPDLGGIENEDTHFAHGVPINPEINRHGSFSSMCIELDIWDLALNTVLQSDVIYDMDNPMAGAAYTHNQVQAGVVPGGKVAANDGTAGATPDHEGGSRGTAGRDVGQGVVALRETDHSAFSPAVFGIFRTMVKGWTDDVRRKNRFASHLLEHLFRWITSPSAKFFDPALFRFVHDLMKRVFGMLVGHVRQLGSEIVYASFDKLVISTNKTSLSNAMGYITYAVAAIAKKDAFAHIEIRPSRFWRFLMWMDPFNWAGVEVSPGEPDTLAESRQSEGSVEGAARAPAGGLVTARREGDALSVDMKWSMLAGLPRLHQQAFMRVVAEFLDQVCETDIHDKTAWLASVSEMLSTTFKRRLLGVVRELSRTPLAQQGSVDVAGSGGPSSESMALARVGSKRQDPHLEFVKCLCAILGLDEQLDAPVRLLKRDLLSILGVNEFSSRAAFTPPPEPLVLHQVICEYCSFCRDLDLTRDRDVTTIAWADQQDGADARGATAEADNASFWVCSKCHMEYDRPSLEQRLVDLVVKRLTSWQLQDLRCSDCRFFKAEDMRAHCPRCKSAVATTQRMDDFARVLSQMNVIAQAHGMEMLGEIRLEGSDGV
nr:DNA polymerase epsilon catalytic subunit [Polyrhizophydium stewartii]